MSLLNGFLVCKTWEPSYLEMTVRHSARVKVSTLCWLNFAKIKEIQKLETENHIIKVAKSKERKVKNIWKNNYQKICHLLCWYWINKINHRKICKIFCWLWIKLHIYQKRKTKSRLKTVLRFFLSLCQLFR